MLAHLQIRDFAIIDSVELELAGGLTALTGETGAGKSIVVDAVMLALGGRASADALRHGAERAECQLHAPLQCGGRGRHPVANHRRHAARRASRRDVAPGPVRENSGTANSIGPTSQRGRCSHHDPSTE